MTTSQTPPKIVTLGLIQMSHGADPQKNVQNAIQKIRTLALQGAQIISVSELFSGLYFCQENNPEHLKLAEPVPGQTTQIFSELARELGVVLVLSLFEKDGQDYYNTACVLDADGTFLGKYRKVHIPDDLPNYYSEQFYFKDGDLGFPVFKTRFATIGVQICWDQWFPEGSRLLALKGAEIVFYPTAIGWQVSGNPALGKAENEAWVAVQRGHAISNTMFVAAINRIGTEDHLQFWGTSFVADPLGRMLRTASSDREELLLVSCDLSEVQKVRKDWPFLKCRRTAAYKE